MTAFGRHPKSRSMTATLLNYYCIEYCYLFLRGLEN